MGFGTLALIGLAGLAGPVLAWRARWHVPVVVGELGAGIVLGRTGFDRIPVDNATLTVLADIGFALVMFVAGSKVPIRDPQLRQGLPASAGRATAVGLLAAGLGWLIAHAFGTGHPALYAVLIASSSAALALPIIDSLGLHGPAVAAIVPQVAIADAACIVALPLAVDPKHALRAAVGAVAVVAAAALAWALLRWVERSGVRRRVHDVSEDRGFAVELRLSLVVLFTLAALAARGHVSILLAGFGFGVAVAEVGEPRRLARQLFALTDGFLGPLFFVWLGASLDLRELARHPSFILLGLVLGLAAVGAHAAMRLTGLAWSAATLAGAQLGVPVAAATVGTQLGVLRPAEAPALILGALVTITAATLAGAAAARRGALQSAHGTV